MSIDYSEEKYATLRLILIVSSLISLRTYFLSALTEKGS